MIRELFTRDFGENFAEVQLAKVHEKMEELDPTSEEYKNLVAVFGDLHEIREKKTRPRVDANTVLQVVGSLAGILLIIGYEQNHVLTSKGLSLLPRRDK